MTSVKDTLATLIIALKDDLEFHGEHGSAVVSYERQKQAIRYLEELEAARPLIEHYRGLAAALKSGGFIDISSNFEAIRKNTHTYEEVLIRNTQDRLNESLSKSLNEALEKLAAEHGTTKKEIIQHAKNLLEHSANIREKRAKSRDTED